MNKNKNNKFFAVGSSERVDLETGESVPIEGGSFKMLPGPDGSCEWCHVKHDPSQPHNKQSLAYQMKFNQIHGRYPTWTDAMAHCSEDIKVKWKKHLIATMQEHGLEIPEDLQSE
jgi:hypothetical protein